MAERLGDEIVSLPIVLPAQTVEERVHQGVQEDQLQGEVLNDRRGGDAGQAKHDQNLWGTERER